MKFLRYFLPPLCLAMALDTANVRAAGPAGMPTTAGRAELIAEMARTVADAARAAGLAGARKEKRISEAVRSTVTAAAAGKETPEEILTVALEVVNAAGAAAPGFAEVIANAAAYAPAVARIRAAAPQLRQAAFAAARSPRPAGAAASSYAAAMPPAGRAGAAEFGPAREGRAAAVAASTPTGPRLQWGNSASLAATLTVSSRYDDNVFLRPRGGSAAKVGDTILAVTPGLDFQFGQDSLTRGSIEYRNAFTRYADGTSPSAALSSAAAAVAFDNGSLSTGARASFDQIYQNSSFEAARQGNAILRRDVLTGAASLEAKVLTRTRVRAGVAFDDNTYKSPGFIGTRSLAWPLNVYLEATPRLALSLGSTFTRVTPDGVGASVNDAYYNIGFRGALFSRLNGELSVGYRSRDSGSRGREETFGFDGRLAYDPSEKSRFTLSLTRDFGAGAFGESTTNNSAALRYAVDPTPRWQFSAGVAYRESEFGSTVFAQRVVSQAREDTAWEGSLLASFMVTSWISVAAEYSLRHNASTVTAANVTNNLLGLSLTLRY
jgi:hypothetical protein